MPTITYVREFIETFGTFVMSLPENEQITKMKNI